MDYRNLGKAGVKVSPVCLGTMMFGGQTSEADSIRIIHQANELGINFIDTADMYAGGESEVVTGKAIADRRNDPPSRCRMPPTVSNGRPCSTASTIRWWWGS